MTDHDLETALRAADPAAHDHARSVADEELLRSARAVVDARRAPASTLWRRRVGLVAAIAAAVTVGHVALGSLLTDEPGGTSALPAAVAADGQLSCRPDGEGYAAPVAPEAAALRLLPQSLPSGWALRRVFAREETGPGSCADPALVALDTEPDGTVTATVSVTGPISAELEEHGAAGDEVGGRPAERFTSTEEPGWSIWWWADEAGRQWSIQVQGYPVDRAREVLRAVTTDGHRVVWDAAAVPGLDVVHERRGTAGPRVEESLAWYLVLSDGEGERMIDVHHETSPGTPVAARAFPGTRLVTVAGQPAVLGVEQSQWTDGDDVGPVESTLQVQLAPGTTLSTTVRHDLFEVEGLVASLTNVPASDPRLTELALDE